jgi:hypothetical protein
MIDSGNATYDTQFFQQKYNDAVARYKSMYKSEITLPRQSYYSVPNNRPRRFIGRNFY